ncbi:MAG: protein kinase [Flavobacterium sp.]|uniref:protein kinase domain-containing protein n=1 Tax=Flavobacterium sp. TaxID=239 RepID=UPI003267F9AA
MPNFLFPEFVKMYRRKLNVNLQNISNNLISIGNVDYLFNNLTNKGNKGGNSVILKLYRVDQINGEKSFDAIIPLAAMKILKFPFEKGFMQKNLFEDVHLRFLNEIQALESCNNITGSSENVINIFEKGECIIEKKLYLFYTMELAEYDLKSFIEEKHSDLQFENKIQLCLELLDGIGQLDRQIFYHRDIKPDNILFVGNSWKIGDLGLVAGKSLDNKVKEEAEFIGPRGWVSPEVMNKHLSENKGFKYVYDCEIDHQSDIFQLGKLFWYIFQHNAPIGNINFFDFNKENERVFWILRKMLHHNKTIRFKNVADIIPLFQKINQECIIN